jgi:hypothetical protein
MTMTPPDDASSLLVPVFLDAFALYSQNQTGYALYTADYSNLVQFQSPLSAPFTPPASTLPTGIYLHWALPDALTHGHAPPGGGPIDFPCVPNRWLVARFNTPQGGTWQCRLWVVQSDYSASDGSSAYLDPFAASNLQVASDQDTVFNIQYTNIGKSYTIDTWHGEPQPDGKLFLKAVGPGNVSFAAYVPFVQDVFSFVDSELPADGIHTYTYLVVGWYSNPGDGDPLRGVTVFDPNVWESLAEWQGESEEQRLQTLLQYMQWSVQDNPGSPTPSTSLYHGLVVDVQWPPPDELPGSGGINSQNVAVAVGNTGVDALAALVQAQQNSSVAADTLAELLQAALYDLLDDYTVPGGAALIREQVERAWFGSDPGGIVWSTVSTVPQAAGQTPSSPNLTAAQTTALNLQLAALNQNQQALDAAQRHLASLQGQYYMIWLKVGMAKSPWFNPPVTFPDWSKILKPNLLDPVYPDLANQVWDQLCLVTQAQAGLPCANDSAKANAWANQNWKFPNPAGGTLTLSELGLALKAGVMPNFWHPNDPVVLIAGLQRSQKHGADGRYNADGTLSCRLPGQSITGLQITGQPTLDVATLEAKHVDLVPYSPYNTIPSIPSLVREAFLVAPENAQNMATAIGGDAVAIGNAITELLQQADGAPAVVGTAPPPFAMRPWQQAWVPMFLEWSVNYYPTGSGTYSPSDWTFDGETYTWAGTNFDPSYLLNYQGRTLLTAQAPVLMKAKIERYLANNRNIDSQQLEALLATVGDWDLLSQSLSGLLDQLITLVPQELLPPQRPPGQELLQCPRPSSSTPKPSDWTLIGGQFQQLPMLQGQGQNANFFYPIRGGFLAFQNLQVVDAFGQTYPFNFEQGFLPIPGSDLAPTGPANDVSQLPVGALQLTPRLIQSARLDLNFLANDDSRTNAVVSGNPNTICGWLLPNHLDGAIAVYDADGIALGELVAQPAPYNWRPRPGAPGQNPPPPNPAAIANTVLREVITSFAAQPPEVFNDLLQVIDETLWMVDPLGGRKDQFLSVLIGRPLAVVQISLQLGLNGDPAYNQLWNFTLNGKQPHDLLRDTGNIESVPFPVRLGSLELRDDGVIGYLLPAEDNATFYAVHYPDEISPHDTFVRQIVQNGQYQGNISLTCQGPSVTATLIIDPRGSVHAYTGILPVLSAQLPPHAVETFMKQLQVTFSTGPIIADPGTLRIPKPAENHGTWSWIQRVGPPANWESDAIVDADDKARLPDGGLQLREGWLQLSDIDDQE